MLTLAMAPSGGFLSGLTTRKFKEKDIRWTYFGNYLRDMSQAIDVGTLSKGLDAKTIALLVWIMSFMEFGYATEEFEVTQARLGVYRPEEHIDNPKGYPSPEEPDARKFDSRLRGPVSSRELEIDPETGMKRYIAEERSGHMTSSAFVRNSLVRAIELGREYRNTNQKDAKYESFRILGQAMHTLEDFSAHSNYIELVLIELGHDVFPHCGSSSQIRLGNRHVYPLVTGTFGGLDFVHSLLGEATDKLSATQIDEVAGKLNMSQQQSSGSLLNTLMSMISNVPGSSGLTRDLENMQSISQESDQWRQRELNSRGPSSTSVDVDTIVAKCYPVMAFRDRFVKAVSAVFEKIPGLNALIDRITETLTLWVLSTIEPFVRPVINKVTGTLQTGSSLVTSTAAQNEVFDNPQSTDPTHSMLAKDHLECYLNNPAGLIAQAVVRHTVQRVVAAWADTSINPLQVIDEILETFHHPALPRGRTSLQREMRDIVQRWVETLGGKRSTVLQGLSREGLKRGDHHAGGAGAHTHGYQKPSGRRDIATGGHSGNDVPSTTHRPQQSYHSPSGAPPSSYRQEQAGNASNHGTSGYGSGGSQYGDARQSQFQSPDHYASPQGYNNGSSYGNQPNQFYPDQQQQPQYGQGPPPQQYGQGPPPQQYGQGPPPQQYGYDDQSGYGSGQNGPAGQQPGPYGYQGGPSYESNNRRW